MIGQDDLKNGITHGWLSILANKSGENFQIFSTENGTEVTGGPTTGYMYITAIYFTMTCMTSIGFGNVAADTYYEKVFALVMMTISSLLYAAIFGHVTTIIHNMTLATAKYHETLNGVQEFMKVNEVPSILVEKVTDYIVSKWMSNKGVEQDKVLSISTGTYSTATLHSALPMVVT